MQVVILCGGTGTRLKEMTAFLPKPLIPIGGKPIVWHIMQHYMRYGHNSFILALGYKQEEFKRYFHDFDWLNYDCAFNSDGGYAIHTEDNSDWSVTLVNTGPDTLKGGRLNRVKKYIVDDDFMVTYGDGVSNVDLHELVATHHKHKAIATITGIHPMSKFGILEIGRHDRVICLTEKPESTDRLTLTNGGFMVFNKHIFSYLDDECDLEIGPLENIAKTGEMFAYRHNGFWKNMDTLKDVGELEDMWQKGDAPWT